MYYVVDTEKSFEQACTDLESAVAANGFGVLTVHDIKETLAAKGVSFAEECKIFEICNPVKAARVLESDMRLSLALPCRISVFTEKGSTMLSLIRPVQMLAALSDDPDLAAIAQEVEEASIRMVDQAR